MLTYAFLVVVVMIEIHGSVDYFRKNACWMDHAMRFSTAAKYAVVLLLLVIFYHGFIMQG